MIDAARASGFRSVNIDLIYGLPRQTVRRLRGTLDKVVGARARPHRALQLRAPAAPVQAAAAIVDADLPAPDDEARDPRARHRQPRRARATSTSAWTISREPDDELARRAARGQAAAQFPGLFDAARLRPARPSASRRSARSGRPTPEREDARRLLRALSTPARCRCLRGFALADDDLLRRDVIQQAHVRIPARRRALERAHGFRFARALRRRARRAAPLAADGLVDAVAGVDRRDAARPPAVRIVAMAFDRHLREARERASYSRVI